MTAHVHTPETDDAVTTISVDGDSITQTVVIGERAYTRTVEVVTTAHLYGADADGHRGERRVACEVARVDDDAPVYDTPEWDIWDSVAMDEESLLEEWAERWEGE